MFTPQLLFQAPKKHLGAFSRCISGVNTLHLHHPYKIQKPRLEMTRQAQVLAPLSLPDSPTEGQPICNNSKRHRRQSVQILQHKWIWEERSFIVQPISTHQSMHSKLCVKQ